jgi:hypothetical protein
MGTNQFEVLSGIRAAPSISNAAQSQLPAGAPKPLKVTKLSKNIMGLKFMQRAENKDAMARHSKGAEVARQKVRLFP